MEKREMRPTLEEVNIYEYGTQTYYSLFAVDATMYVGQTMQHAPAWWSYQTNPVCTI